MAHAPADTASPPTQTLPAAVGETLPEAPALAGEVPAVEPGGEAALDVVVEAPPEVREALPALVAGVASGAPPAPVPAPEAPPAPPAPPAPGLAPGALPEPAPAPLPEPAPAPAPLPGPGSEPPPEQIRLDGLLYDVHWERPAPFPDNILVEVLPASPLAGTDPPEAGGRFGVEPIILGNMQYDPDWDWMERNGERADRLRLISSVGAELEAQGVHPDNAADPGAVAWSFRMLLERWGRTPLGRAHLALGETLVSGLTPPPLAKEGLRVVAAAGFGAASESIKFSAEALDVLMPGFRLPHLLDAHVVWDAGGANLRIELGPPGDQYQRYSPFDGLGDLPEELAPQTTAGAIAATILQFTGTMALSSKTALRHVPNRWLRWMLYGGVADTLFNPEHGNLSKLLLEMGVDPNVVLEYLGAAQLMDRGVDLKAPLVWLAGDLPDDPTSAEMLEQRFKNFLEGTILGLGAEGVIRGGLVAYRKLLYPALRSLRDNDMMLPYAIDHLEAWRLRREGVDVSDQVRAAQEALPRLGGPPSDPAALRKWLESHRQALPMDFGDAPMWFSRLTRGVEDWTGADTATADQWAGFLGREDDGQPAKWIQGSIPGVSRAEVQWSGIHAWLADPARGPGKITKQEVLEYLRETEVIVQDLVFGAAYMNDKQLLYAAAWDTPTINGDHPLATPVVLQAMRSARAALSGRDSRAALGDAAFDPEVRGRSWDRTPLHREMSAELFDEFRLAFLSAGAPGLKSPGFEGAVKEIYEAVFVDPQVVDRLRLLHRGVSGPLKWEAPQLHLPGASDRREVAIVMPAPGLDAARRKLAAFEETHTWSSRLLWDSRHAAGPETSPAIDGSSSRRADRKALYLHLDNVLKRRLEMDAQTQQAQLEEVSLRFFGEPGHTDLLSEWYDLSRVVRVLAQGEGSPPGTRGLGHVYHHMPLGTIAHARYGTHEVLVQLDGDVMRVRLLDEVQSDRVQEGRSAGFGEVDPDDLSVLWQPLPEDATARGALLADASLGEWHVRTGAGEYPQQGHLVTTITEEEGRLYATLRQQRMADDPAAEAASLRGQANLTREEMLDHPELADELVSEGTPLVPVTAVTTEDLLAIARNRLRDPRVWDALLEERVPDLPFKASWAEITFRRMLREAAETGHQRLAWVTGNQSLKRYYPESGGRIAVSSISWSKPLPTDVSGALKEALRAQGYIGGDRKDIAGEFVGAAVPHQVIVVRPTYKGTPVSFRGGAGSTKAADPFQIAVDADGRIMAVSDVPALGDSREMRRWPGRLLRDVLGEELHGKIVGDVGSASRRGEAEVARSLNSGDLPEAFKYEDVARVWEIGGAGFGALYDQRLVNYARKYGKQWGAEVGMMDLAGVRELVETASRPGHFQSGQAGGVAWPPPWAVVTRGSTVARDHPARSESGVRARGATLLVGVGRYGMTDQAWARGYSHAEFFDSKEAAERYLAEGVYRDAADVNHIEITPEMLEFLRVNPQRLLSVGALPLAGLPALAGDRDGPPERRASRQQNPVQPPANDQRTY